MTAIECVIEPCLPTSPTIDVTHPGDPNSTNFAGKSFHAPLPRHHLTTLRAFTANLGLGEKYSSRKTIRGIRSTRPNQRSLCSVISSPIERAFRIPNTIRRTSALVIRCSPHTRAMLLRHRWTNTEILLPSWAHSGNVLNP